jgi:hypothetical protein
VLRYAVAVGCRKAGSLAGTSHGKSGYWQVGVDGKRMQAHRVIFAIHHGFLPEQIDHINGDKADNKIENLRAATNAQNHWNTGLRSTNTSGVKGVHWHKSSGKWAAVCRAEGRYHNIGLFDDIADAARSVESFRLAHHGAFARHAVAPHIAIGITGEPR